MPGFVRQTGMRVSSLILVALLVWSAGCTTPPSSPSRPIQPVADAQKTFTVHREMAWYDVPPANGIRFPTGVYELEGEDAEFWYFRAPVLLDLIALRGRLASRKHVAGGIMIPKRFNKIPARGYIDAPDGGKTVVWEVSNEFRTMEGRYWSKSF